MRGQLLLAIKSKLANLFVRFSPQSMFFLAASEGLPKAAPVLFEYGQGMFKFVITNSMLVALVVAVGLIAFVQISLRNVQTIPGPAQNFCEAVIEGLAKFLESILGWRLLKGTFWFFATVFIFIFVCNLQALMPGVGTIGGGFGSAWYNLHSVTVPWMRGANADVNMTGAMSIAFFFLWWIWAFKYNGVGGTIKHIFGSPIKGLFGLLIAPVFFFVGLIELISIAVRPVSLTFRLFGNIYGGEAMIEQIKHITGWFGGFALIPVYAFELLVALVQALVFCLLTAVFTAMMCKHDHDAHGDDHADSSAGGAAHP
jgi:F-type H+-transporting ATPase subunit a